MTGADVGAITTNLFAVERINGSAFGDTLRSGNEVQFLSGRDGDNTLYSSTV